MSGFLYRGRDCGAEKRTRPRSIGPMMDYSCDGADKGPPPQMHSLREFEQHLNDLKKENFSLKLRIYFLEEKIQQKFEESSNDVHRRNIELKVEVASLKKDLEEKHELLEEALMAAESLSNQNEAELQRRLEERQEEISHMQQILEAKVQRLQQEAELAQDEAQRMASLADSEAQRCLALEREMEERKEESCGSGEVVAMTTAADRDRLVEELTQHTKELEVKVHELSSSLRKKEQEAERLVGEQQDWIGCYETATDQCVGELQVVQNQVRSLQAKIRESETRNQELQNQLVSMELDLRSAREEAQQQERRVQNLIDTVGSKEAEAAELYGVIDEQNQMLHSLRELTNRRQLQGSSPEASWGQNEVLALQASLFKAQLELQATQRAQRWATRTQEDQNRALERLEDDLRGALEHRREAERHNQELQLALQNVRTALQEREDQLRESEHHRKLETEERERIVKELRTSLQTKDQLLEDHQHVSQDPKEHRDLLVQKLRQRVKERDRALERAVDEKFRCMEEKEEETRRVQLLLRDKERDLERQRRVLSNNQETITSLEVLLRGKVLELEQVSDAWRSIQQQQQNLKDGQNRVLRERDAVIDQLQVALQARTQEAQDLRCSLLTQVQSTPGNVLEELKVRLHLKDRLFQEVLADRTRQAREHQDQVQDLLGTISSRDRYIQESAGRFSEVVAEQTDRLQELRRQLSSGGGPRPDPGVDLTLELQAVQEELQLVLRRLEENQDLNRTQAVRLDTLSRTLQAKDDIIRDLQNQLVDPSELPLVERLTQEVQNLREILQESTPGPDRSGSGPPQFGGGHQRSTGRFL